MDKRETDSLGISYCKVGAKERVDELNLNGTRRWIKSDAHLVCLILIERQDRGWAELLDQPLQSWGIFIAVQGCRENQLGSEAAGQVLRCPDAFELSIDYDCCG